MKKYLLILSVLVTCLTISAQKITRFDIQSPNGKLKLTVVAGEKMTWSLTERDNFAETIRLR